MGDKWLEVLTEAAPATRSVLVLMHQETVAHKEFWRTISEVAGPLHIEAVPVGIHNSAEIERAIAEFATTAAFGPQPTFGRR